MANKSKNGFEINKILAIPVGGGEGIAHYQVTKIGRKNVTLMWRGDLGQDKWQSEVLQNGGTFSKIAVNRLIKDAEKFKNV